MSWLFNLSVGAKLYLDGGGVRSLSSLLILKSLMERVHTILEDRELRPADVFNYIYGSSSGGYAVHFEF